MFNRQARPGVLLNQTDNFIQLARLMRLDAKPVQVDALAEIHPANEEALTRWLKENFTDYRASGYVQAYCGFHPAQRVFARENLNSRRFADPTYLPGLIAERAKVSSAKDWQMTALDPSEGILLRTDGIVRPGLLFGVPWAAIREQQRRLLELGLRPRRLEVGTLTLLGTLTQHLAQTGVQNATVVCEIEYTQTRTYVVAKDGVHTLFALPHGLLSMIESAMKELGSPDVTTALRQLENPDEALRVQGRRLVRVVSRHLKPAVDHFELKTGQRIENLFCAQLPAGLDWLGLALGAAVDLEVLTPDFATWLLSAGLKVEPGAVSLNSSWLGTLSLVAQLA